MRKFVVLAGILLLGLLSVNAYAEYYAFAYSGFNGSNNLTINGNQYFNNDSGWINSNGQHLSHNTNYFSGEFEAGGSNVTRNYFSFNLTGLTGTVTSASFNVFTYGISVPGPYQIFGTSLTPAEVASNHGFTNLPYWSALASSPMVGSISFTPADSYTTATVTLNSAGLSWLQSNEGNGVTLGGQFLGGPVQPTPEPGTMVMFGSGLLGLAGIARRKFNL